MKNKSIGIIINILTSRSWERKKLSEPIGHSGYLMKFDEPTKNGNIYVKESFKLEDINKMLMGNKDIKAFGVDDIGLHVVVMTKDVVTKMASML